MRVAPCAQIVTVEDGNDRLAALKKVVADIRAWVRGPCRPCRPGRPLLHCLWHRGPSLLLGNPPRARVLSNPSAQESTLKGRRPKTKVVIFVANCRAAKHLEPELGNGYMDKSKTPCGVNTNLIWRCALRP